MNMPRLTRRQLFKTGVFGAVALVGAVYLAGPPADQPPTSARSGQFLTAMDVVLVELIAPVLLGVRPGRDGPTLDGLVQAFDAQAALLSPAAQNELRELFGLLQNRWSRRWLVGLAQPWAKATPAMIERFLSSWRDSAFLICRSGYQALHRLSAAAWYGQPSSWLAVGYQLPVNIQEDLA